MSKLIAFDIDGTLLDSWPLFESEVEIYSKEKNLTIPCVETIKVNYAQANEVDFKWGLELHEQRSHLHKVYERIDDTNNHNAPPMFDGAIDFLKQLKMHGYTLGIVTSKPSKPMQHVINQHNLDEFFCGIRTSCDVRIRNEKEKPAPDQLLSLAKELSFETNQTIMIGDTTMDMQMGVNANVHTIGVTWGNHCINRLTDAGANNISNNGFDELLQQIINVT